MKYYDTFQSNLENLALNIGEFFSKKNYLPVYVLGVIVILGLIFVILYKKYWLAAAFRYIKTHPVKTLVPIILVAILSYIAIYPRVEFKRLTTLRFPANFPEAEKKVLLENLQKTLQTHNYNRKNPVLYSDMGILKAGTGDYEGSLENFKKAAELDPKDPRFYRNIAITYRYLDKYTESEAAFKQAQKLAPENPRHWIELGELYAYKLNDTKKARLFYLEAIQTTQNNILVLQAYANFLENVEKDYGAAIDIYNKLAEVSNENKGAYLQRAAELKLRLQ